MIHNSRLGTYCMPAEWETHDATWLAWPANRTTWPGKKLKEVESIYIRMMQALLACEKVHLLVKDIKTAERVLNILAVNRVSASRLIFHRVNTVDAWIRDYGPIFVSRMPPAGRHRESTAFTKWIFNAWGGKYSDLARDNKAVDRLDYLKKYKRFDPGIVLEGGSIDVNGRGTCLTTEQCLLNPNRNPKLSRKKIERYLSDYLGIQKVIWLKEGIEGDDTDGHVDDMARFVDPNTVVAAMESDPEDKNHAILKENLRILKSATDAKSRRLKVIELPMPGRVGRGRPDTGHSRLPASYANFYIANGCVLLPLYSHSNDKKALGLFKKVFPGRKIVGIECSALVYGLGSIHCVTQQEPVAQV